MRFGFYTCVVAGIWPGLGEDVAGPVQMCFISLAGKVPEGEKYPLARASQPNSPCS